MVSKKVVTPVKTGVQRACSSLKELDSGFRRNDRKVCFPTFFEFIKVERFPAQAGFKPVLARRDVDVYFC